MGIIFKNSLQNRRAWIFLNTTLFWERYCFKCSIQFKRLPTKCISPEHKVLVHIYLEHQSICPLVGIGTAPSPLQNARECLLTPTPPTPNQRGGTLACSEGMGSPNSDDWRKSLAQCLLCGPEHIPNFEPKDNILFKLFSSRGYWNDSETLML
jgi:hypothetical protein